ncbi:hypothetical protein OB236_13230 [Paenibacillus sp. WQ 127069]|uniref:Uncharacterized protein n=1 Tax=Paenibacillus baimaensis TaxID=2982185 RepID=A0ABT2UEL0_9BACL|nr:hypothetical protein [Paenibacillus sp. WQ 127069]MCU6793082.1 hypothetical protein [Paenibacillus sp. WQ 127069]
MSSDDFNYDVERFAWVGIGKYYTEPSFEHKKGSVFSLEISVSKPFELVDKELIPSLLRHWTYGEDRGIKPFKLIEYQMTESIINAKFETIRKSKKHDEIKLFLIDIVSVLKATEYDIDALQVVHATT